MLGASVRGVLVISGIEEHAHRVGCIQHRHAEAIPHGHVMALFVPGNLLGRDGAEGRVECRVQGRGAHRVKDVVKDMGKIMLKHT